MGRASRQRRRATAKPQIDTRRGRPRIPLWLPFLAVTLAAVGLLGLAVATGPVADATHRVVTVDGVTLDRTALRGRIALDQRLLDARHAAARTLAARNELDATDLAALNGEPTDDPVRLAIDELVEDQVLVAEAGRRGLATDPDLPAALAAASGADLAVRVRVVSIRLPFGPTASPGGDWPAPPTGDRATDAMAQQAALGAALARAARDLAAGQDPAAIAADATTAGWQATGRTRWLPHDGPVEGLPAGFVSGARAAGGTPGSTIAPTIDPITGIGAVGDVLGAGDAGAPVDVSGIDEGAVRRWAAARAAEAAIRADLAGGWGGSPVAQVRLLEVPIGTAALDGVAGHYRSFAHVVVRRLPPAARPAGTTDDESAAVALAAELRGLAPGPRAARFQALIDAANASASSDPLERSGEMAYFTRDQVLPSLADPGFADGTRTGDVIGPVTTGVGPELFLVRAQFDGVLDERANAALVEVRTTADLLGLAERISPVGEASRASGSLWRAEAEADGSEAAKRALTGTPIGALSDPFVLGGEIVVVRPLERRSAPAPADVLARLLVGGFDAWLGGRIDEAAVDRDAQPLPGVELDLPSASPSPSPTIGGAVETPVLPSVFDPFGSVGPGGGAPPGTAP